MSNSPIPLLQPDMDHADDLSPPNPSATIWSLRHLRRNRALEKCNRACKAGDIEQVQEILRSGDLYTADLKQLMFWTTGYVSLEVTRCLLEHGADAKCISASTLVGEEHLYSSLELFKLLASFGLDYNSSSDNPLIWVVHDREILDWLLDQGADINRGGMLETVRGSGRSYSDNTCGVLNKVAAQGDIELFDHLVSRGADPARSNALHYAVTCEDQGKSAAMIQHLIETYRLDVNAHDGHDGLNELADTIMGEYGPWGRPLNIAIRYGNLPAIDTLLKYNADVSTYIDKSI